MYYFVNYFRSFIIHQVFVQIVNATFQID